MSKPHLYVGVIGGMSGKTHINLATALAGCKADSEVLIKLDTCALQYQPSEPPIPISNMTFYKVCKRSMNWAHYLCNPYSVGYERQPVLFIRAKLNQPQFSKAQQSRTIAKFRTAVRNLKGLQRLGRRWKYWEHEATKQLRAFAEMAKRDRYLSEIYMDLDKEYFEAL